MTHGAKTAIIFLALAAATVVVYKGCASLVYNEAHKPAGLALAAAVEAYHAEHKRFPAKLEDLVPRHLPAVPRLAGPGSIAYARLPDSTQCWVAYSVHRDYFEEYDCRLRRWNMREYEETQALKHEPQVLRAQP